MPRQYTRVPIEDRLWARVTKSETCWLVPISGAAGYGQISYRDADGRSRNVLAHRLAWTVASGVAIPDGLSVCHTCDVRHCVRNDESGIYVVDGIEYPRWGHLFLAPQQINAIDAVQKGHHAGLCGEAHHAARLTEDDVRVIRHRYASGDISQRQLAHDYSVHVMTISHIVRRKNWPHVV